MTVRRFVRFWHNGRPSWGQKEGQEVLVLTQPPWLGLKHSGDTVDLQDLELLAPAEPSKIVCVGLNYRDHAAEMGLPIPEEPLLFLKPVSALQDPGKPIRLPRLSRRVDYEAELAFVVGKAVGPGHDEEEAIFGYTCANDVTARDLQSKDGQWTRAKGFDTFCPLGPELVAGLDVSALPVECRVNGEPRQASSTQNLIFDPQQILHFVTDVMTLLPGDVILTGTPAGIGPLKAGDEVEVSIGQIGRLFNKVV